MILRLRHILILVAAIILTAASALSGTSHSQLDQPALETSTLALKPVVQLFTTHPDQLYYLTISSGGRESVTANAHTLAVEWNVAQRSWLFQNAGFQSADFIGLPHHRQDAHLEALGDKYGDAIIVSAELLEALADHIKTLTPRQQGYYKGRATVEIVTLVFAWEAKAAQLLGHAAKFTKGNLLKALSNIPFFQTENGLAAFNKLAAQGDYVTRLAATKMNQRNFALFERGFKSQNNNPWSAQTATRQRFDGLPTTDPRRAKNSVDRLEVFTEARRRHFTDIPGSNRPWLNGGQTLTLTWTGSVLGF